ncbi:MAG TPA: hypothetical protein PJ982_20300, partial [Lacipirellulaceae bacterium]|nr:hypothetical protein [Lacipirellulaceae bacterium]
NVCGGAKYYEGAVANSFGGVQATNQKTFTTLSGKTRIADRINIVNGTQVPVEAKFTSDWSKSIYNPRSPVGPKPFAKAARANMVAQARDYITKYGKVIYRSNSQELIDHYTRVFSKSGIDVSKIDFQLFGG